MTSHDRKMAHGFVWLAMLPLLLLLSCKEEILVSSQDALVDPRFAPNVVLTYPPLNSAGPYSLWGDPGNRGYGILVRFNKLMDPASVRAGLRLASSLRPLRLEFAVENDDPFTEEFTLFPSDSGRSSINTPRIGEVFTLRAVEPIVDINGKVLPPGVIGTMRPEPYFRVTWSSPTDGGVLSPFGAITLRLNDKVNAVLQKYVTTLPLSRSLWGISPDSMSIYLPASAMLISKSYEVRVAAGAVSATGAVMPDAFVATFASERFVHRGYSSSTDTIDTPLDAPLSLSFSLPVDVASARRAFHIDPDVGSTFSFSAWSDALSFTPLLDYEPMTRYTLTIDTTLRAMNGLLLDAPVTFSFTTGAFAVRSTWPADRSVGVSTGSSIFVLFSGRLDTSTVRAACAISPRVEGMNYSPYGWGNLYLVHSTPFQPNTTYTVTIDTSLRSQRGLRLAAPYVYSFTTGGS